MMKGISSNAMVSKREWTATYYCNTSKFKTVLRVKFTFWSTTAGFSSVGGWGIPPWPYKSRGNLSDKNYMLCIWHTWSNGDIFLFNFRYCISTEVGKLKNDRVKKCARTCRLLVVLWTLQWPMLSIKYSTIYSKGPTPECHSAKYHENSHITDSQDILW